MTAWIHVKGYESTIVVKHVVQEHVVGWMRQGFIRVNAEHYIPMSAVRDIRLTKEEGECPRQTPFTN